MTISEHSPVARKKSIFLCEKNYFRKSYARLKIPKIQTREKSDKNGFQKTYFVFELPAFNKKLTDIFF